MATSARLGDIIYWTCCALSMIAIGVAGIVFFVGRHFPGGLADQVFYRIIACAAFAVLIWLFGRAMKYVLTGK